jgi:hypothetical protein
VLAIAASMSIFGASPAIAGDPDIFSDWKPDNVTLGGWTWDSANGGFVELEPGVPNNDPNVYKVEYLCLDQGQNNFDVACLAAGVKCTEGENGRPVRWFSSLKAFQPSVWTQLRPDRCVYADKPEDVLGRIAAEIQSEFQRLPVAAGTVTAQPSPHTLRGAETNFFADSAEQQFDIIILAQKVHVVATPVQYTWNYGDGTSFGPTTVMGGPLPQDRWGEKTRTSHVYTQTGDFQVVLTTHFQGTYSVNNGPPLPIPGQGQFNAPPQTISVWRSITRNYADDCIRNPQGQGCPGVAPPAP